MIPTTAAEDFRSEIESIRQHTQSYATDGEFQRSWSGFTRESRNYKAQQVRAFGELVGTVTTSLSGWRILDVGCGNGHWLRAFLEFGARPQDLVGIDVSDVRFEAGRARNPLIALQATDGIHIPFEDNRFHLVTQFVCFSNIPTQALREQVATEMQRVVRPGGYIFWWDLFQTSAPTDFGSPLSPSDYLFWPEQKLVVGELPRPSECLAPRRLSRLIGPWLDRLSCRPTHLAALFGPKP